MEGKDTRVATGKSTAKEGSHPGEEAGTTKPGEESLGIRSMGRRRKNAHESAPCRFSGTAPTIEPTQKPFMNQTACSVWVLALRSSQMLLMAGSMIAGDGGEVKKKVGRVRGRGVPSHHKSSLTPPAHRIRPDGPNASRPGPRKTPAEPAVHTGRVPVSWFLVRSSASRLLKLPP